MKRIATLMKLKPGAREEYTRLHDEIWPGVVQAAHNAHMQNYTIFCEGEWLFSYYEYTGENFEADMDAKSALPVSKEWQKATGKFCSLLDTGHRVLMLDEIWHHDFLPDQV